VITAVRSRPTGALLRIGSTLEERTAIAQRAAAHLRAGGFVMMAGDGMAGDVGIPVDVLSQKPLVRPGLATLARISRAPVFPVSGTWDGHRIHVRLHDPLQLPETTERDAFLQGTAERIGNWLDRQIRTHPEGLTPGLVRWLFNIRFTVR
jgi:lauroyl/myristoyl acyltransferase